MRRTRSPPARYVRALRLILAISFGIAAAETASLSGRKPRRGLGMASVIDSWRQRRAAVKSGIINRLQPIE
jgi:hypothetical protein